MQIISCKYAGTSLPDCPKKFGNWTNVGGCAAIGQNKSCGPGYQHQMRVCIGGTRDKCTGKDQKRKISCEDAATKLTDCKKEFGDWTNDGGCKAIGNDKTCGLGNQKQTRRCLHGTTDKCTKSDTTRTITCSDAGNPLPTCRGQ